MDKIRTKEAAEDTLRELPSVLGAYVREDIYGHPREVHLLVAPGPNVRHLARDVRDLLEERLQVPIDQRIISIAQVTRDPSESPVEEVPEIVSASPEDAVAASAAEPPANPRLVFGGIESMYRDARVVVRVRLAWRGAEYVGEGNELDAGMGRVRAAASAALRAAATACENSLRLDLEGASTIRAFERDYILVAALAAGPSLGRRPLSLTGAHPDEGDIATAGALAALKAVNRVVAFRLKAMLGEPKPAPEEA